MMRVVELFSSFPASSPTILNSRQASFVERNRALSQLARAKNPRMPESDGRERDHGPGQPPGRNEVRSKRSPRQARCQHGQEQPGIPQLDMDLLKARNPKFAGISPLSVFFGREHRLKM